MKAKAKFKMGQGVRCVNEKQRKTVIGISESAGFHYDIKRYGGDVTLRVAETSLVDFETGK